jgi:hypothetical protein
MHPLFSSILLILAFGNTCNAPASEGNNPVPVVYHAPAEKELPPNWPWRGVSVESKKTRPSDVAYLASVNANFMRIMLKPDKKGKREKWDPVRSFNAELAWADSLMDEAKKHNITCLIAFNNLILDYTSEVNDKSAEFWDSNMYQDSVSAMIETIVKRNKNRGSELAAYEFIGEPALEKMGGDVHPPQAENFYQRNLSILRAYDQKRYFLLTPGPWGKPANYKTFGGYNIKDDKLIYGSHMYMPDLFTHQGVKKRPRPFTYPGKVKDTYWDKAMLAKQFKLVKDFETKTNALIYVGEFQSVRWAPGANYWIKDVLELLEANNWAWSMYAFQCDTEFWDPYYDVVNPKDPPAKWRIEYKGQNTDEWKLFTDYFKLNKKQ